MSIKYEPIPCEALAKPINLQDYQKPEIALETDPAITVMTNFSSVADNTITIDSNLDQASTAIVRSAQHILLVTDENNALAGIISSHILLGSKPATIMEANGIAREQVSVKMLMRAIDDLPIFTIEEVQMAKVGNVIRTLSNAKRNYALVIDSNGHACGLFLTPQISKQLHSNIVLNYDQTT